MGLKVFGFFGGGLGAKVAIAGLVAGAVAIGILTWRLSVKDEDLAAAHINIGEWKQAAETAQLEIGKRDTALAAWATKWGTEKARQRAQDARMLLREQDNERLAANLEALRGNIRDLRRENIEVDTYLGQPIPSVLLERLRAEFAGTQPNSASSRTKDRIQGTVGDPDG